MGAEEARADRSNSDKEGGEGALHGQPLIQNAWAEDDVEHHDHATACGQERGGCEAVGHEVKNGRDDSRDEDADHIEPGLRTHSG